MLKQANFKSTMILLCTAFFSLQPSFAVTDTIAKPNLPIATAKGGPSSCDYAAFEKKNSPKILEIKRMAENATSLFDKNSQICFEIYKGNKGFSENAAKANLLGFEEEGKKACSQKDELAADFRKDLASALSANKALDREMSRVTKEIDKDEKEAAGLRGKDFMVAGEKLDRLTSKKNKDLFHHRELLEQKKVLTSCISKMLSFRKVNIVKAPIPKFYRCSAKEQLLMPNCENFKMGIFSLKGEETSGNTLPIEELSPEAQKQVLAAQKNDLENKIYPNYFDELIAGEKKKESPSISK